MPLVIDTKNNKSLIGAALRTEIVKSMLDAKQSELEGKYALVMKDTKLHEDFIILPLSFFLDILKSGLKF